MELEFQHHIKDMMHDLQNDVEDEDVPEPIDYNSANATNKEFFTAAQNRAKSPTIRVYNGNTKKETIRAATEVLDTMQPAVVNTSGSLVKQKVSTQTKDRNKETPERLYMYADPVSSATMTGSSPHRMKRLTKEQFLREQEDKTRTLKSIEPLENEVDPLEGRMNGSTRDALAKSREILRETANLKGVKRRKKKKTVQEATPTPLPTMSKQSKAYRSVEVIVRPDSGSREQSRTFPPLTPKSGRPASGSNVRPGSGGGGRVEDIAESYSANDMGTDDQYVEEFEEDYPVSSTRYVTQPVGEEEVEGYYNKHTWENHLARHILSVFATSHASDNPSQSKAVLEMVDGSQSLRPDDLKTKEGIFTGLHRQQKRVEEIARRPKTSEKKPPDTTTNGKGKTKTQRQGSAKPNGFRVPEHDPIAGTAHDGIAKLVPSDRPVRAEVAVPATKTVPASTVRGPPKVFPIWFYSSGDPYAEWLALPDGHRLQNTLDSLRERKLYMPYLERVAAVLEVCVVEAFYRQSQELEAAQMSSSTSLSSAMGSKSGGRRKRFDDVSGEAGESSLTLEELRPLCRQLVLVANAFATLAIENKQSDKSMGLIRIAEIWAGREDILNSETRAELRAYIDVTLAFYFFKRKMTSASQSHSTKALDYFTKVGKDDFVAMCLLMLSCCKYQISNFKVAHKVNMKILFPSSCHLICASHALSSVAL